MGVEGTRGERGGRRREEGRGKLREEERTETAKREDDVGSSARRRHYSDSTTIKTHTRPGYIIFPRADLPPFFSSLSSFLRASAMRRPRESGRLARS